MVCNGRNYMQLGIAGCFPVEPRCCCCGLRTFPSAPKPQLTYSFCYWLAIYSRPYFSLNFLFSIFCRVGPESRRRNCLSVKLSAEMKSKTVEPRETVCRAVFKILCRNEKPSVEASKTLDQRFAFSLNTKLSNEELSSA